MADGELTVEDHIKKTIQMKRLMAEKAHELGKKYIMVDIDGTICHCPGDPKSADDQMGFREAVPFPKRIEYLNLLIDICIPKRHYHYYVILLFVQFSFLFMVIIGATIQILKTHYKQNWV